MTFISLTAKQYYGIKTSGGYIISNGVRAAHYGDEKTVGHSAYSRQEHEKENSYVRSTAFEIELQKADR